ncbi:MAG: right-handed parallel beta-helix repeat-containing protein [archaeon]
MKQIILIMAILLAGTVYAECGVVTTSITLTEDLVSSGTCFTVTADNIVIDGNGHSITDSKETNSGDTGILVNGYKNVVVKNFKDIKNYWFGIKFQNTDGSIAENNRVTMTRASSHAIYLLGSTASSIIANTIDLSGQMPFASPYRGGITVENGGNNNIKRNSIKAVLTYNNGIFLKATSNNVFESNTIHMEDGDGILVVDSSGNSFTDDAVNSLNHSDYRQGSAYVPIESQTGNIINNMLISDKIRLSADPAFFIGLDANNLYLGSKKLPANGNLTRIGEILYLSSYANSLGHANLVLDYDQAEFKTFDKNSIGLYYFTTKGLFGMCPCVWQSFGSAQVDYDNHKITSGLYTFTQQTPPNTVIWIAAFGKKATPSNSCTDSDGTNYYEKGSVTVGGVVQSDYCKDWSQSDWDFPKRVEQRVVEYYCDNTSTVGWSSQEFTCVMTASPNGLIRGCANGACVSKEEMRRRAEWVCYDGSRGEYGDEFSCKSSQFFGDLAHDSCRGKCDSSGNCGVKYVNPWVLCSCDDSDGGIEPFRKGSVSGNSDRCVENGAFIFSGTKVEEQYCENGLRKTTVIDCPNGCVDGTCVRLCSDTDFQSGVAGWNYGVLGTASGHTPENEPRTGTDYCIDQENIREFACNAYGQVENRTRLCSERIPGTVCRDGACISEKPCLPDCTKGDGVAYQICESNAECQDVQTDFFGSGSGVNIGGCDMKKIWEISLFQEPYCVGSMQYESYSCDSHQVGGYTVVNVTPIGNSCVNGCENGKCNGEVEEDPTDGSCKGKLVLICHKSSFNHEICVSPSAVSKHLAHGDYTGKCQLEETIQAEAITDTGAESEKLTDTIIDDIIGKENDNKPLNANIPANANVQKLPSKLGESCGGLSELTCEEGLHCDTDEMFPDLPGRCRKVVKESVKVSEKGGICGAMTDWVCAKGLFCKIDPNVPEGTGLCNIPPMVNQVKIDDKKEKLRETVHLVRSNLKSMPDQKESKVYDQQSRTQIAIASLLELIELTEGIDKDISDLAFGINSSLSGSISAEVRLQKRSGLMRFFFGGDRKATGDLEMLVVRNVELVSELNALVSDCNCDEQVKSMLKEQIQAIAHEQVRLRDLIKKEKKSTGLLGWIIYPIRGS